MKFSRILQNEIIDFLKTLPTMHDSESQRAFIYQSGLDHKLQDQIPFGKPPSQFVPLLVSIVTKYGKISDGRPALVAILETAENYIGEDRSKECKELIKKLVDELNIEIKEERNRIFFNWKLLFSIIGGFFLIFAIFLLFSGKGSREFEKNPVQIRNFFSEEASLENILSELAPLVQSYAVENGEHVVLETRRLPTVNNTNNSSNIVDGLEIVAVHSISVGQERFNSVYLDMTLSIKNLNSQDIKIVGNNLTIYFDVKGATLEKIRENIESQNILLPSKELQNVTFRFQLGDSYDKIFGILINILNFIADPTLTTPELVISGSIITANVYDAPQDVQNTSKKYQKIQIRWNFQRDENKLISSKITPHKNFTFKQLWKTTLNPIFQRFCIIEVAHAQTGSLEIIYNLKFLLQGLSLNRKEGYTYLKLFIAVKNENKSDIKLVNTEADFYFSFFPGIQDKKIGNFIQTSNDNFLMKAESITILPIKINLGNKTNQIFAKVSYILNTLGNISVRPPLFFMDATLYIGQEHPKGWTYNADGLGLEHYMPIFHWE